MRFINELHEGDRVSGIYLCKQKQSAMTKNGKPYDNVILQDKTGVLDGKIWDPNSLGIDDFDTLDYIDVVGDVTTFAGAMQLNIKRVRKASEGEYNPADYLPVSENSTDDMYGQILNMIKTVKNEYLSALLNKLFVEDKEFLKSFQEHSAAKTVHHGFIGGLMEHTLSVTKLCDYMANAYPLLKRDLLITAALLHDVGKTKELSSFPLNDYTDEGQLLGHIIIGAQMIHDLAKEIPNFPETLENQLVHCILAHHGELEYGSPKKPALAEAVALNLADNTDARMETLTEIFAADKGKKEWLGYNRLFESNLKFQRTPGKNQSNKCHNHTTDQRQSYRSMNRIRHLFAFTGCKKTGSKYIRTKRDSDKQVRKHINQCSGRTYRCKCLTSTESSNHHDIYSIEHQL